MWTLQGFSLYPLLYLRHTAGPNVRVCILSWTIWSYPAGMSVSKSLKTYFILYYLETHSTCECLVYFILCYLRHSRFECAQQAQVAIQTHKRLNRTLISTGQRKTCAKFQGETPLIQASDRQIKNDEWKWPPYLVWVGPGRMSVYALYNTLKQCIHICYILYKSHVLVMVSKCQMWGCVLLC